MTKVDNRSILKWNSINQLVNLGSKFVISVILQRILQPADFGIIANILVFASITEIFIDSGFQSSIIQAKEIPPKALSTIFYLNIGIGATCTILLYGSSHLIGTFYNSPLLTSVARLLSVIYLLQSFVLVQRAIMIKEHLFKVIAIVDISSNMLAGIIAVIMAVNGWNVWSITAMYISQIFIANCLIWIKGGWWPRLEFDLQSIKGLWRYGSKVLAGGFLVFANNRIDLLMTGRFFSASQQGLYSRGKDYGTMPSGIIIGIISKSYFPIFSRLQDEAGQLKDNYFRALGAMSFIAGLLFPLLFLCSGDAVAMVLKEKWFGMIPVLQLFVILSCFQVFNSVNINFLAGTGRSKTNLATFAIVGPLRVISVVIYFLSTPEPSLTVVSSILVLFSFAETSLSFYFISRIKSYPQKKQYLTAYGDLGLGWVISISLFLFTEVLFHPRFSPFVHMLVCSFFYFSIYLFICFKMQNPYLRSWLRSIPALRKYLDKSTANVPPL